MKGRPSKDKGKVRGVVLRANDGQERLVSPRSLTRGWGIALLRLSRGTKTTDTWFQTSGLQNCETIPFCYLRLPGLWCFL